MSVATFRLPGGPVLTVERETEPVSFDGTIVSFLSGLVSFYADGEPITSEQANELLALHDPATAALLTFR